MEGVAETATYTQGYVWFQVSGAENDAEKIGVEAYALEKITKDPLLHPIPHTLKWYHSSNLKLANSDFRTLAHIDLLLGLKYSPAFFVIAGGLDSIAMW